MGGTLEIFHLCHYQLMSNIDNALMSEELNYDRNILRTQHSQFVSSLTTEKRNVYDLIMDSVYRSEGGVFFVNGFGGSGKIFIWNTLTSALRSRGDIVLAGRTAHSRFPIPLDCNLKSTCNIMQGSDLANLMVHTKLIIWDEAPMVHRYCFETLDRSLRDIMGNNNLECDTKPFGGKVVVFGDDCRQILPVIPRGSRQDIVLASLNSSYIWDSCKIGDGLIGDMVNDEESEITVPGAILISEESIYLSSDSICSQDQDSELAYIYTTEFLNTISGSGLHYHELKLKVGAPVMLMRNIDKSMRLCNGTKLIITRLCNHVVEAMILSGVALRDCAKLYVESEFRLARMLSKEDDTYNYTING
ncbi:ATP-dependent DNA helicase PIF1-like [Senna tora]|uniref:ATP-dependent DNA helicase n=1 Tax=Senna tora TaxID=362788 RepID=A0A835CJR5_9FABA|nr:ATP-dependent DNA helicase PIF1-like [Senna tora]